MIVSEQLDGLVDACQRLAAMGFGTSTAGNLSGRVGDQIFLTATKMPLGKVSVDNLACTDLDGKPQNAAKPTKDAPFHLAIYRSRPDVQCVLHAHPVHCVAVSTVVKPGSFVPALTAQFVMRSGRVPVVPYFSPGTPALAEAVGKAATELSVLLQNHGAITFADSFTKALWAMEELEENCRQWLLVRGDCRTLSEVEIAELIDRYGGGRY